MSKQSLHRAEGSQIPRGRVEQALAIRVGFPEEVSFVSIAGWFGLLQRVSGQRAAGAGSWELGWCPSCGSTGLSLGSQPFNELSHTGGAAPSTVPGTE